LCHLQKYTIYHTWVHLLHYSPSSPPPPKIVSTDITFPFTYMCTQYLYHIHSLWPFPHLFSLCTDTNNPRHDLFHLPFSNFV
jgi:hypothetical protein